MPPKRKSRTAQLAPQTSAINNTSDYETDTANYTDTGLPMAALAPGPPVTNDDLNRRSLRRWFPTFTSIVAEPPYPYAVLYLYDPAFTSWEKLDTEGPLFICQIQEPDTPHPTYSAIILNRKNLQNWRFDLQAADLVDTESSNEFILLMKKDENGEEMAYGIWQTDKTDEGAVTRQRIGNIMKRCAQEVEQRTLEQQSTSDPPEAHEEQEAPSSEPVGQRIDVNSLFNSQQSSMSTQQNALLGLFKQQP